MNQMDLWSHPYTIGFILLAVISIAFIVAFECAYLQPKPQASPASGLLQSNSKAKFERSSSMQQLVARGDLNPPSIRSYDHWKKKPTVSQPILKSVISVDDVGGLTSS